MFSKVVTIIHEIALIPTFGLCLSTLKLWIPPPPNFNALYSSPLTRAFVINVFYKKQGRTRHRPMAHPVVLRYLSYSTTLEKHAVHRLRRCPAFGRVGTCLFLSVNLNMSESVTLQQGGHKTMGWYVACLVANVFKFLWRVLFGGGWADTKTGLCLFSDSFVIRKVRDDVE